MIHITAIVLVNGELSRPIECSIKIDKSRLNRFKSLVKARAEKHAGHKVDVLTIHSEKITYNMTPKQKAEELIHRFRPFVENHISEEDYFLYSRKEETENARKSAIVAVQEIQEVYKTQYNMVNKYWAEVRTEIDKFTDHG